jgi:hypothetical protein
MRPACHAEGRGFESLQPLRKRPAFAGLFCWSSRLCSSASGRTDAGLAVRRSPAASRKTPGLQADSRSSELKSFCGPAEGRAFACCSGWTPVPANDRLLPLATLVTPNLGEALLLPGRRRSRPPARGGPTATCAGISVGAHQGRDLPGRDAVDLLVDGHHPTEIRAPRATTSHTHGTGDTLASAITAVRPRRADARRGPRRQALRHPSDRRRLPTRRRHRPGRPRLATRPTRPAVGRGPDARRVADAAAKRTDVSSAGQLARGSGPSTDGSRSPFTATATGFRAVGQPFAHDGGGSGVSEAGGILGEHQKKGTPP